MIVDVNMHWFPEETMTDKSLMNSFLRGIPRAYGEHVKLLPGTDGRQFVMEKPRGYPNINHTNLESDTTARLKAMDEAKVDKAILRIAIFGEWLNLEMCKTVNDLMAKCIRKHPDRFLGLAVVPPWGDEESLDEVDRCINDLGFCGVQISAHYGTLYLDEEEFRPFFKKLNELGVPVCMHHIPLPVEYGQIYKYTNLRRLLGRDIDLLTSLGRIIFSGLLDEFPNLKLIPSEMGGGFFAYADEWFPKKSTVQEAAEHRLDSAPGENTKRYLERNLYFDASHPMTWGKAQFECAVKVLGADHILFGSSYSVRREWLLKGPQYIQSLDIGGKEKSLILGENAVKLFNIKA